MAESRSQGGCQPDSGWAPRAGCCAFRTYASPTDVAPSRPSNFRLLLRLTKDIVKTYQTCNRNFNYSEALNPKRFLTNPSAGVLNDGHDNANSDLILYINLALGQNKQRYIVKDILGQGTFGQVAKCWDLETDTFVAVKIIKNHPAYYQQARVEVSFLTMLNRKFDPDDKHHMVRILDCFEYQRHLCISFEMLGSNLFELIKINQFKGLSLSIVQVFSKQILQALIVMKDAGIIHCDLKPENILLTTRVKPPEIKVIDFGSACQEGHTVYSYIQSRYYRSPEVLLGHPYTTAIDMWSFGCIVAELFLGLPLFPGASEYDLLKRMIEILGGQPPDELLRDAKNTSKFFKQVGSIYRQEDNETCKGEKSAYRLLTEEEFEARGSKRPLIGKRYFNYIRLEDIIANYPYRKNLPEGETSKENKTRLALVDFLRGLVEFDPGKRWSPLQASRHPFVTGEPFTCPYKPPPETPRIQFIQSAPVHHNPGGGHWLGAGLSPQVSNMQRNLPQNNSHFHMASLSHGTSYGSIGSYGSYNDNAALGSSYGSYGDVNSIHAYYSPVAPSGLHMQAHIGGSILVSSPDTRSRHQVSLGNGFGMSPSAGGFGPMSLGASPSQFTPPNTQMHMSTGSPGMYASTSHTRGSQHGSPLGKAAAGSQYNRRRSWGHPGNSFNPQDNTYCDGASCSQPESFSGGHGSSRSMLSVSNYPSWRSQMATENGLAYRSASLDHQNMGLLNVTYSDRTIQASETSNDKSGCSSSAPDPADWDPNYSDELLLQEDKTDMSNLTSAVSNGLHIGRVTSGASRLGYGLHQVHSSSSYPSNQRTDGISRTNMLADGSPPSGYVVQAGHGRPPHIPHNSLSRFGQHPAQRFNYMHPHFLNDHSKVSNYYPAEHSSPSSTFGGNGISWGRSSGHPIASSTSSSRTRKDYGKIR